MKVPNSTPPPGADILSNTGIHSQSNTDSLAKEEHSVLMQIQKLVTAPFARFRHRPWLQNLNDGDQEDGMEYHNPTLALLGGDKK